MNIKYQVVLTHKAKIDLKNIYKYISENLKEKNTADNLMNLIEEKILILEDIPEGFAIIEYYKKKKYEYRRLLVKNYIVIYRIDKKNKIVYVVKIIHGRRNYLYD